MTAAREPLWIGVDVSGTKVLAGVVDESGDVVRTSRGATPGRRLDIAQVEDALQAAVLEVVVIGGGVSQAGDRLLEPARTRCSAPWWGRPTAAYPIVSALLGPDAGLVDAAELARRAGDQPRR